MVVTFLFATEGWEVQLPGTPKEVPNKSLPDDTKGLASFARLRHSNVAFGVAELRLQTFDGYKPQNSVREALAGCANKKFIFSISQIFANTEEILNKIFFSNLNGVLSALYWSNKGPRDVFSTLYRDSTINNDCLVHVRVRYIRSHRNVA